VKTSLLIFFVISVILYSCTSQSEKKENIMNETNLSNPLLTEFNTPYNVPPFDKIKNEHYIPAYKEAIKKQEEEINEIVNSTEKPTFENTIVALDNSGELLSNVDNIFQTLESAITSEEMQDIAKKVAPLISKNGDDIKLNAKLFERITTVYNEKDNLSLDAEQSTLLDKTYKGFVRGGANLNDEDKTRFREINEKLSVLTVEHGENQLKETNAFTLLIDNKEELAGLPQSSIDAAFETAKEKGEEGKWIFTVQKPSLIPFLQYSEKRELRERMLTAYIMRGDNNNENDNKKIVAEIVNLRLERANLLGFDSHAAYVLDDNMAKTSENVYELLNKLFTAALPIAKKEVKELQALIDKEGGKFKLEPWDWWYYAEKIKKEKYAFDEEELRPYFKLENVLQGAFDVANKLYDIKFKIRTDIPTYHNEASVYEVLEADGTHIGILYMDFFPRESKRAGAWMTGFRKQSKRGGQDITPVISVVCNFSKPTADKPALLNFDEVETLFHEFGHALHGLLSECTYYKLSGTSVARDFVELPSQIMENWAGEPEVLKMYAKHYKTGEIIPDELIEKLKNSGKFNQGFATIEFLSAAFLDLAWHTVTKTSEFNVNEFEKAAMDKIALLPEIIVRYRSTYFSHIFSGGYSSGYYSYIWAAILDADAFEAFKETSLFDKKTATAFRENILSKGGTKDPMLLYKRFRGAEPSIEPLLKRKGLK